MNKTPTSKKTAPKKVTVKKVTVKKVTPKKMTIKKTGVKKTASKKVTHKKVTPKKIVNKTTPKKVAPKKTRLGRGLGALLGDVDQIGGAGGATPAAAATDSAAQLRQLPIEQLRRGAYQPRARIEPDALEELAQTIRAQGVIQPLLVREIARDRYEIIAGERRWRAAQRAGLTEVPVVVRAISDKNAMAVALIENIQRQDLNALEEAAGFRRLLDEFGLTHQQIADAVGYSRAAVTNLLRLLGLHSAVKKLVQSGQLDMGHARALLALPDARQPAAAQQVVGAGMSVRQTELLVNRLLRRGDDDGAPAREKSADVTRLENELAQRLGARVVVQHRASNGRVVIHYNSLDELDGIVARIKK